MKRSAKIILSATSLLAFVITMFMVPSCEIVDTEGLADSAPDSLITVICLGDWEGIRNADIFIYDDDGLHRLEGYARIHSPSDSAVFKLKRGDKAVVALANCRDSLDVRALNAYDTMEMLPFFYRDDNTEYGTRSCSTTCAAGDTLSLKPVSPMCRIVLESIEHEFDGYKRLEDPIIYLSDVNPYVEALRRDSFLPSETDSDTTGMKGLMWDRLPYDIGMYPQSPGTVLFCYPNESPVTPTRLTVEGLQTGGRICRFSLPLPPLSYGCSIFVSLEISNKPEDYKFTVSKTSAHIGSMTNTRASQRAWETINAGSRDGLMR